MRLVDITGKTLKHTIMIAKNITELRNKFGYTQKNIADYLDIATSLYGFYETEMRPIPVKHVSKLALLYNVEEYDLYEENPEQQELLTAFAFRADYIESGDLETISEFKKIVLNYYQLTKALENE